MSATRSDSLDKVTDPTNATPEVPKKGLSGLADQFLKPKKQKDIIDTYGTGIIPPEDRKEAMQSLNKVEQRLGYFAAAIAVLLGGLATLIFPRNRVKSQAPVHNTCPAGYSLVKGQCQTIYSNNVVLVSIIVVIFAVAIFACVRMRRRTPTIFTVMLTGIAFISFSAAIGIPFVIYGGWLLLRARRIQKFGTTDAKVTAKAAAEERAARKAGQPSPRATRDAQPTSNGTSTKSTASAPDPSGRYTPKAPTRKKPAPAPQEKKPSRWRAKLEGLDQES